VRDRERIGPVPACRVRPSLRCLHLYIIRPVSFRLKRDLRRQVRGSVQRKAVVAAHVGREAGCIGRIRPVPVIIRRKHRGPCRVVQRQKGICAVVEIARRYCVGRSIRRR